MTKDKNKSSQPSLFDYIKEAERLTRQSAEPAPGSLDVEQEMKAAVAEDLKHAIDVSGRELSRAEVAARMTDLAGAEITLTHLNNWTAPSHPHSMPAKYLPALVIATGGRRSFETLSRRAGLFALPSAEALRAEIQKMDEEMKLIKKEKAKRQMYLKEISEAD